MRRQLAKPIHRPLRKSRGHVATNIRTPCAGIGMKKIQAQGRSQQPERRVFAAVVRWHILQRAPGPPLSLSFACGPAWRGRGDRMGGGPSRLTTGSSPPSPLSRAWSVLLLWPEVVYKKAHSPDPVSYKPIKTRVASIAFSGLTAMSASARDLVI